MRDLVSRRCVGKPHRGISWRTGRSGKAGPDAATSQPDDGLADHLRRRPRTPVDSDSPVDARPRRNNASAVPKRRWRSPTWTWLVEGSTAIPLPGSPTFLDCERSWQRACLRILRTSFITVVESLVTGGRLGRIGIPFRIFRAGQTRDVSCLTALEAFQPRTLFLVRAEGCR